MFATHDARTRKLIDATVERVRRDLRAEESENAARLAASFFAGALSDDCEGQQVDDLFGMSAAVWEFVRHREPDSHKVRVYNADLEAHGWYCPHTVIESINTDTPFLLDSTVAALNQLDLTLHLVIHPVIAVQRDESGVAREVVAVEDAPEVQNRESLIHVQVTRQTEPEALRRIEDTLNAVYADVRAAVADWRPMLGTVAELIEDLSGPKAPPLTPEEIEEGRAFLQWLHDGNFTFLGSRDYRIEDRAGETYLSIEGEQGLGILRSVSDESRERHAKPITSLYAEYLRRPEPFVISKAWERSRVHRPVYMDYIGVRRFDSDGKVVGERRFLGLFTSVAYSSRSTKIPLLRRKVERVLDRSGLNPRGHDIKALANILETFPRDELFQIEIDALEATAHGILHMEHRQRIRLFLRRDAYGQFFSALIFVPREIYSSDLRRRMERILVARLGGSSSEVSTQFSEAPMVRAHFIVHAGDAIERDPDIGLIERELADAARSWDDDFLAVLIEVNGEAEGTRLHRRYASALPASYKAELSARAAVADIGRIESLSEANEIVPNLYRRVGASETDLDFKVYHHGPPIPPSRILPMLEAMGLVVQREHSYEIRAEGADEAVSVHDFRMTPSAGRPIDVSSGRKRFEDLFVNVWKEAFESDGFNSLVLEGLEGREIALLRAYAKYLRQIKAPFSLNYMQESLVNNPEVTRLLVGQFHALHDPDAEGDPNRRAAEIRRRLEDELDNVEAADEDRILRRFLNLVDATLRTNFFQRDGAGRPRPSISIKFDSAAVSELPSPRPWREIFVYNPRFEAVHLRGGRVARGGIRWSDRRDDFRTEILGLVKAQMVKNSVIVPVGAKGGFVLKRPPANGGALGQEGVECYRLFVSAMLDITDNLVDGEVRARERLLRHDGDDPYLVVAADKGTATFSDIANDIALEYGHWLGDAFASGGSVGYDHKGMGITARGAWEAVKRHFREIGTDIMREPFTVVGVGDMSGDVFGNGMLLSEQIRLVGAFNHMHIFIDPDPDPAVGFEERKRLFELPRSRWTDYEPAKISKGGGVFERHAKSIQLTPQIRQRLGLKGAQIAPNDLIRQLLQTEVDLLWHGGIGTYVKARRESHAEVDDRANDSVRVNADELRCKVVGEGGNLGVTQAGRIEFALRGGRINTDAIDNSGGVDCSDREVNIKILLNRAVAEGDLTGKQRDRRLADMTDEVAQLVLRDNYVQTGCMSLVESLGGAMFGQQVRHMRALESKKLLDRDVEGLPSEDELAEWRAAGRVFTRPEIAVLLAYAKMDLFDELIRSDVPDDPYLRRELIDYFPSPLRTDFGKGILDHQLRREIIATVAANDVIDRAGITFVHRRTEHTGIAPGAVVRAYYQARDVFELPKLWDAIDGMDESLNAAAQARMNVRVMSFVDQMAAWFLRYATLAMPTDEVVGKYRTGVEAIRAVLEDSIDDAGRDAMARERERMIEDGAPSELAAAIAQLGPMEVACDIVQAARETGDEPAAVAKIFYEMGRPVRLRLASLACRAAA